MFECIVEQLGPANPPIRHGFAALCPEKYVWPGDGDDNIETLQDRRDAEDGSGSVTCSDFYSVELPKETHSLLGNLIVSVSNLMALVVMLRYRNSTASVAQFKEPPEDSGSSTPEPEALQY
eukprot:TRINITY_DN2283_c0_g1_i1.p2 TRINITY_DN2283_c0_g1~~TRINITY_DN2283_c0_g1_i1.p2  ORF type:complete len:121 (+),score=23.79 TRINITY_DN2283_c0_g1_i1:663-1025(+)